MRPWRDYTQEIFADCPNDDRRWVLGIEGAETHRLRVAPLIEALGERTVGIVLNHLVTAAPFLVEGPEDLEWIIDGWLDGGAEDNSAEARKISRMAKKAAALELRINKLLTQAERGTLDRVDDHRLRRLVVILTTLARHTVWDGDPSSAWTETADVDWSPQRPVIHLVWDDDCPLSHALSEAEHILMQDGSHPTPQNLWLLDPADPNGAARTWQRWMLVLRRIRTTALLVDVLEEYIACLRP